MVKATSLKVLSVLAVSAWALSAGAAPKATKPAAKPAATKAESAAAASGVVDIEIVQQLGADKGAQLQKLVDKFNEANPTIKVSIVDRNWLDGQLPDLMVLKAEDENKLVAAKRFKPVWEVMKEGGKPLKTVPVPRMVSPYGLDSTKRPIALPIALGTPVTFYNKAVLQKAGLDMENLPKTWAAWQGVLGKVAAQSDCPFTTTDPVETFIENTSAWNNQPYVTSGKTEQLAINGLIQIRHIAKMNTWVTARYLHLFGHGDEALDQFVQGKCAVMTATSSDYPTLVRQAKFEVGVTTFPYDDDAYGAPQNTLADGPGLWVGSGKKPAEYKAIAKFIDFWLTPASQVQWQVDAGYLPLNNAGIFAATESDLLTDQMVAQKVAIAELTNKPVTDSSRATAYFHRTGMREMIAIELDNVWTGKKPSKQALDDAVARSHTVGSATTVAKTAPAAKKKK